ncbi:MAG: cellulase family glycosylhydrolase [Clostridia bacterium]|nr:cellulase family glycosylhydrolase [Clostridia bacterium]
MEKWTEERIWKWYNERPWIRGCNYMSADCANRIDQWQSLGFEERFETTDKELSLMEELGFNTIRIIIEFLVWDKEHDGFMDRFERYLDLCAKHGISCMVVLANDCMRPKGSETNTLGEQKFDIGYHGGRKVSQHGTFVGMGDHVLDYPDTAPRYFEMVREIVERYKNDERIIIWNVYNEAGNSKRHDVTLGNLKRIFEIVREINPVQPLTCEAWSFPDGHRLEALPEVEKYALENSDIISYHSYSSYEHNVKIIKRLKEFKRPIICTEWLGRCLHNNVEEMFPLFYLEKIGCYNWGFVAGKYQTFEPWNNTWDAYDKNPDIDVDFTKWFHDIYRPNHKPYNPKETELIRRFCTLADEDFERENKNRIVNT